MRPIQDAPANTGCTGQYRMHRPIQDVPANTRCAFWQSLTLYMTPFTLYTIPFTRYTLQYARSTQSIKLCTILRADLEGGELSIYLFTILSEPPQPEINPFPNVVGTSIIFQKFYYFINSNRPQNKYKSFSIHPVYI